MRKMREYIVKGKRIFVGLEDSKKTWKLCVRSDRMVAHETSMPATYENLRNYFKNRYPECEVKVMYEAGFGGFWLHDRLVADSIECIVTPANKVTEEKSNKVKTDKRDARRLAKNLENEDYTACSVPDKVRREDRQISRTLEQITKQIVRTKNQIRMCLSYHGLNEGLPEGKWKSAQYYALKDLPLSDSLKIVMNVYLELLKVFEEKKNHLQKELRKLCKKERYSHLMQLKESTPGIGWLTAIRLTLEWGELSRFPSGKHFSSFVGLTPGEYSTGETIHREKITGQSSSLVRGWLVECAWRAIRQDPVLLDKFRTVWKNSASKKKAIVAVARKMAVRMRAMELTNFCYCIGLIE
jgi:transposase